MVELHWPRRSTFRDSQRDERFVGPGTFDVPDDAEEQYRERGWVDPPEAQEAPPAPEPDTDTQAASDQDQDDSEGVESPPAPDEGDSDEAEAESEAFDADAFVDDSWQGITAAIEDGDHDDHLDAIQEAEEARDSGPRDSVISAIEARRG